jgi:hypothetical protein
VRRIGEVLALVLAVVFLAPTLRMPFLGDDAFNSYLDGWIHYERLTPAGAFSQLFVAQNFMGGRFYPIFSALLFSQYHFIHSVELMKVLVLGAMLLNALTLYFLLRIVAPSLALPALALLPATWQIRFFHDAIVQFSLHMQLTLEFVLVGFIGLALFVRDNRLRYLVLGAGAYACACLTYEPAYAYAPVLVVLAAVLVASPSRKALSMLAFAIPPLVLAAVALWFRALHPLAPNDEHAIHAAIGPVLVTFAVQALGALPLSYGVFDPGNVLVGSGAHVDWWTVAVGALAFVAVAVAFVIKPAADRETGNSERGSVSLVVATAACCWLASGTLVALSPRWQSALAPGLAYTPVYFADAFVAVILAALGVFAVRALPKGVAPYAAATIAAVIVATTYRSNAAALEHYAPWSMTEPLALDAGILRDAPKGATVFLDGSYPANAMVSAGPWNVKYFLDYHTGRRFSAMSSSALPSTPPSDSFVVFGMNDGLDRGEVIAGRVVATARVSSGNEALVTSIERYVRAPGITPSITVWRSRCGPVLADGLLEGSVSALALSYLGPFYAQERDGVERWRWSSASGALLVANPTGTPRTAHLRFAVRPIDASTEVRIAGPGVEISHDGVSSDMTVNADLHIAPYESERIELISSGPGVIRLPDARPLLFQVRDATLVEADC